MKTESSRRLNRRLLRALVLQIVLISATAVAGIYLAEIAIREVLIVSALEREADYFWARQNFHPETKAPNTNTLIGYVFDTAKPSLYPEEFQDLSAGIHDLETPVGQSVVHVSEANGRRLFLVFDADNVRQIATYFGLIPLALMLIVLYTSALLAYRIAGRAVSPVVALARNLRDVDLEASGQVSFKDIGNIDGADDEVLILQHALEQLVERVNKFVDRERNFTRETSHELRSPLTVIKIAADMLLSREDMSDANRATASKIRRAVIDMEELTQAFLLLAREGESGVATELVSVNETARQELERCGPIYAHKPIELNFEEECLLSVSASPKVLAVVIGNIIRNACAYTDQGFVSIRIDNNGIHISDSGIGISDDQLEAVFTPYYRAPNARESGHGIGLSLVKRMTDRFGWFIDIKSQPNRGTEVTIAFPNAEFEALAGVAVAPAEIQSAG